MSDILTTKGKCELLRAQLEGERASFIPHWRDMADHIAPRRARFTSSDVNRGDRRNQKIVDSTATFASRTMAAGMMAGMTSPARPWFRLITADIALAERPAVKAWLHETTTHLQTVFARSNLYNALAVVYGDMGNFSTGCMFVEEDDEDGIRCTTFPIGSYLIANDHKLRVRTWAREFRMTVRQIVTKFGDGKMPWDKGFDWSKFSTSIKSDWDANRREVWKDVVHVVYPNDDYNPSKLESKFKQFRGIYYEKGGEGDQLLEDKGHDEFPVLVPRWEVTGEDAWGTNGPGMTALGDIKSLQLMRKRGAQAVEKQINPPMTGPTALRTAKASLLPGDITYLDVRDQQSGFRPVHETKVDLNDLRLDMQDVRFLIKRAFYEDLFLMLAYSDPSRSAQPVTAREIEERHEEKLLALGPVLEQTNQDLLDPLIDRTFNIEYRRGNIPQPPPELEGAKLKVEYISIMAQAQKSIGLAGIERATGFVLNVASVKPDVLDKFDTDQAVDEIAIATGIPPRLIVPDEKVAEIRAARAKAEQMAQEAATIRDAAAGAKALSETDTRGENALTDILSTGVG